MVKPTLFAAAFALCGPGCAGFSFVVTSPEGVAFTHAEALEIAGAFEGSPGDIPNHQLPGTMRFVRVRRVTPTGLELYSGGVLPNSPWVPGPEVDEGTVAWSSVKQVRVRPWLMLNILCWGTPFLFYPSFYRLDLEEHSGCVLISVFPRGELLREVFPLWLVLSNRAYCRHIAQAVMFLAGGGKRPGAGPRAP